MSRWRACLAIARVEWLRLRRSPTSVTLLFVVPALQILLFGTAIRPDGGTVAVAIAGPPSAAPLLADLRHEPGLAVAATLLPPGGAEAAVRAGRNAIGVELPRSQATGARVRLIVDAANPGLTAAAEARLAAAYWRHAADDDEAVSALSIDRLYNPDARPDWGFLPALIGVVTMISAIMFGTLGIAREREQGTWETLLALPVGAATMIGGKMLPYVALVTAQGLIVLAIGAAGFGLPVRGSVAALVALLPVFAAAHLALGHALAARAASQIAALQGAIAFYLPAMLLSGFLYPAEALPRWARLLGDVFPLTHFIRAARVATLKGGDAGDVMAQGWPIAIFLAAAFLLAALQHRRLG